MLGIIRKEFMCLTLQKSFLTLAQQEFNKEKGIA